MKGQSVEVGVMVKDVTKGPTSGGNKEKGLLLKATVGATHACQLATLAHCASVMAPLLSGSKRLWMVKFKCSGKFLKNS